MTVYWVTPMHQDTNIIDYVVSTLDLASIWIIALCMGQNLHYTHQPLIHLVTGSVATRA